MNSQANIATHLPIGRKVTGQQNLTGFIEFFFQHPWMISVDVQLSAFWKGAFDLG